MLRALSILVLVAVLLTGWVAVSIYLPYQHFPSQGIFVDIPHGASRRTVARLLANQGVVRSRWAFEGLSRWRSRSTLQAGEYYFDHPMTSLQVFDTIANGRVYVRELVIPEGLSMFDIADLVQRQDFTTRDDFLAAARQSRVDTRSGAKCAQPGGLSFPGDVRISAASHRGTDGDGDGGAFPARVGRNQRRHSRIYLGLAIEQVVTLASLVERETPKAEERPMVAGVFINRLNRHVPLQCDPTVVYALELAGLYNGKLDAASLPFDSPYNTYRRSGLPPGPIANPGGASLEAALNPPKTDYLYFVANTEGGHFFSRTLAEHNHNVALYRRRLAAQRGAAAANDSTSASQPASVPSSSPAKLRLR